MSMDERTRALLQARAQVLARPVHQDIARDATDLILFRVSGEQFGVAAHHVLEVFRARDFARLPESDAPWAGVTVWRGDLLTLLDLRPLIGLPRNVADQMTHVIALGSRKSPIGILAELGRDTLRIAAADLDLSHQPTRWVRARTPAGVQLLDEAALVDLS
jgi:chemotaxis signal transduction protein